jgi:capsid protein
MTVAGLAQISELMSEQRSQNGALMRMSQRDSRFRPPPESSARYSMDQAIRSQGALENMWALANTLVVDAPLVRTALDTRVALSRIMDTDPEPRSEDADLNSEIKAAWLEHTNDPAKIDVYGKRTFNELSASALWCHTAHGDVCAPITDETSIKVCEAWRMRSPSRGRDPKWGFLGVVRDSDGQAIRYYLTKEQTDPLAYLQIDDVEPYQARDKKGNQIFLHPLPPGRQGTRGISALAPVADLLFMQMDAQFCQLVREQLSCCTTFVEEIEIESWRDVAKMLERNPDALKNAFDAARKKWTPQPGAYRRMFPGAKLKTINTAVSPANWASLNEWMTMALAVNLDCPALAITLNAKDANFSQFRNVIHQSKMRFEVLRQWWVPQWHKPVYEHFVRRKAAENTPLGKRLRDYIRKYGEASLLKCEWSWPEYEYIEPVKDITAKALERSSGMITDQQWCSAHHAQDFLVWYGQLVDGRVAAVKKYLEAKSELLKHPACADPLLKKEVYALGMAELGPIPMPPKGQPELMSTYEPPVQEVAPADSGSSDTTGAAA